MQHQYYPVFFRLNIPEDRARFEELVQKDSSIEIHDALDGQLRELIKSRNPTIKIKNDEYPELVKRHLNGVPPDMYGVWVYYPWARKIVHLLDEEEFVSVRTNRNLYKLTREEQAYLATKRIGVIGLSVGQSIALTIAMERVCGELRLADFDTVELSNLNRIRTGVHNLGMHKTVLAAREILEIDPFLKIRIYSEGVTKDNIDDFFTGNGKLDLLVEVCDGLDIKIQSRFKARELGIPVVMDTNDKGMLDVERFDLERDRPILHGLAGDLDPEKIKDLTNEQKIPYVLKMVGADTISGRLKSSMMEIEQTITSWPQLASSVVLGGALTTDTARRILLDQFHDSGRYYIDFDELIADKNGNISNTTFIETECPRELVADEMKAIADKCTFASESEGISKNALEELVRIACAAPSGGNAQPWKFLYRQNRLFIFHDEHFSYSLLDFDNLGSYFAFGAMAENMDVYAAANGISLSTTVFPLKNDHRLVLVVSFGGSSVPNANAELAPYIGTRITNREIAEKKNIHREDLSRLISIAATVPGAELHVYESDNDIRQFADLMTNTERLRVMNPRGHYDTFIKEIRFTPEEVVETSDGQDIATLNMSASDKAALQIATDPRAVNFLYKMHLGQAFRKISEKGILTASCICALTMDGDSRRHFLEGGRATERVWLEATKSGIAFQPTAQAVFMLQRFEKQGKRDFNDYELNELARIKDQLYDTLRLEKGRYPVFMFRLLYAGTPEVRSLRKPLEKVLNFA